MFKKLIAITIMLLLFPVSVNAATYTTVTHPINVATGQINKYTDNKGYDQEEISQQTVIENKSVYGYYQTTKDGKEIFIEVNPTTKQNTGKAYRYDSDNPLGYNLVTNTTQIQLKTEEIEWEDPKLIYGPEVKIWLPTTGYVYSASSSSDVGGTSGYNTSVTPPEGMMVQPGEPMIATVTNPNPFKITINLEVLGPITYTYEQKGRNTITVPHQFSKTITAELAQGEHHYHITIDLNQFNVQQTVFGVRGTTYGYSQLSFECEVTDVEVPEDYPKDLLGQGGFFQPEYYYVVQRDPMYGTALSSMKVPFKQQTKIRWLQQVGNNIIRFNFETQKWDLVTGDDRFNDPSDNSFDIDALYKITKSMNHYTGNPVPEKEEWFKTLPHADISYLFRQNALTQEGIEIPTLEEYLDADRSLKSYEFYIEAYKNPTFGYQMSQKQYQEYCRLAQARKKELTTEYNLKYANYKEATINDDLRDVLLGEEVSLQKLETGFSLVPSIYGMNADNNPQGLLMLTTKDNEYFETNPALYASAINKNPIASWQRKYGWEHLTAKGSAIGPYLTYTIDGAIYPAWIATITEIGLIIRPIFEPAINRYRIEMYYRDSYYSQLYGEGLKTPDIVIYQTGMLPKNDTKYNVIEGENGEIAIEVALSHLEIRGGNFQVNPGDTVNLRLMACYTDGTEKDVTNEATWGGTLDYRGQRNKTGRYISIPFVKNSTVKNAQSISPGSYQIDSQINKSENITIYAEYQNKIVNTSITIQF